LDVDVNYLEEFMKEYPEAEIGEGLMVS